MFCAALQWFTRDYAQTAAGFKKKTFRYDNSQVSKQITYIQRRGAGMQAGCRQPLLSSPSLTPHSFLCACDVPSVSSSPPLR